MLMLVSLLIVCVAGAIALSVYCVVLVRRRVRVASQPVAAPVQAAVPSVPGRLPGMPPERAAALPPSWAAVERKLEPRRAARGSAQQLHKLAANRFDDVLTTGLPVVMPQRHNELLDDDEDDGSSSPPATRRG